MPLPKIDQQLCLKNYLIRCCYHYYVLAAPFIGDQEFDRELKRLQKLEEETGEADKDSPTQIVWGDIADQYSEQIERWDREPEWIK